MNDLEFKKNLNKAMSSVAKMDKIDGFSDRSINTILSALECGIKNPETNAHFEALAMLMDIRKKQSKSNNFN